MRSQTIIILVGGILIGLFLGYEIFNAGSITKKAGKTILPYSSLIIDWRAGVSGEVTEITSESITISSEEGTLTVSLSEETKVKKFIVVDDQLSESNEDLSLSDIEKGNKVGLGIIANPKGELRVDQVSIREMQ
ncbi:MAG TPA: hypothetical protein QGH92_00275 [Candidatus Parcubacteria bacterium]|jgi:hypothetical protein|nr:hypothetical protein [Candidatus Parcubacteria bacterium]|tara:strand:+ start:889 stop:1290 length:402 start_codon:yes stop_codon:yes gene_type:complete